MFKCFYRVGSGADSGFGSTDVLGVSSGVASGVRNLFWFINGVPCY